MASHTPHATFEIQLALEHRIFEVCPYGTTLASHEEEVFPVTYAALEGLRRFEKV
jgi:hypothetical protein